VLGCPGGSVGSGKRVSGSRDRHQRGNVRHVRGSRSVGAGRTWRRSCIPPWRRARPSLARARPRRAPATGVPRARAHTLRAIGKPHVVVSRKDQTTTVS
jgi:hypothetical protein